MKIGDKIFVYRSHGGRYNQTYEEYLARWTEYEIVGETRVSWIAKEGMWGEVKVDKKTEQCRGETQIAKSTDDIRKRWEVEKWSDARYRMGNQLRFVEDIEVLRKVADLIGFDPFNDK